VLQQLVTDYVMLKGLLVQNVRLLFMYQSWNNVLKRGGDLFTITGCINSGISWVGHKKLKILS